MIASSLMPTMKLLFVVVHLGKSKMEVVCDWKGKKRKVEVCWMAKQQTDLPPTTWAAMVQEELEVQDSDAAARARGILNL